MPRKKKNKINQAAQRKKKVANILKGLVYSWEVIDPLGEKPELYNTNVTHKNPIYKLMIPSILKSAQALTEKNEYRYRVDIEMEYLANGERYYRGADLTFRGLLADCEDYYHDTVAGIFAESNMEQYIKTIITVEVLG